MNQQFFPEELNGRFFLKTPKSKKATPLFFAVRINGKSHKFTLSTKVYPQQWNRLLQKAYISPILSNLDNPNNAITNQKKRRHYQNPPSLPNKGLPAFSCSIALFLKLSKSNSFFIKKLC